MSVFAGEERARLDIASTEDRPLTDDERQLLQRLLSDPFSFPIQFKTWLVSFLEGSDLLLPRSSVQGLSSLLGSGGGSGVMGLLPAGLVFPYAGSTAPNGTLICNGAAYSRVGYKRLFDAIGTQHGAGDGSTTFNVPDHRRRIPWGAGSSVPLGASDGQAEDARTIDHHHYFDDTQTVAGSTQGGGGHDHGFSGSTGGGGGHDHGPGGGGGFAKNLGQTITIRSDQGTTRLYVVDYTSGTDWEGDHAHGFSGGTDWEDDHSHWFEQAVTVYGDTSGGGLQDRFAYLVLNFIINF
jgi:hypothetical protein